MTGPDMQHESSVRVDGTQGEVRLNIGDETLADMVEIVLRLDSIAVAAEGNGTPGLVIADPSGYTDFLKEEDNEIPAGKILLLISDEVDIPEDIEYIIVPHHGGEFDLDPGLLTKKVHEMLSGKRPSVARNPVTNLPGAAAFEAELRQRIGTGERFGVVFADLNQFKSYNKAYSYSHGDHMLQALAGLMNEILDKNPHPQNFLAHLGNDDFALITSEKLAQPVAEKIVDSFDEMVASFYDVTDLTRGNVIITDRHGTEMECPIVTIALAVILSSRNALSHAAEAIDIADEMLEYLKSRDVTESCCIVERKSAD
jgi:diguanylate cyclase (GGDEF)-like protein